MKVVIDIPKSYMQGAKILNGSLACEKVLDALYKGTHIENIKEETITAVLEIINRRIVIHEMMRTEANDILHETIAEIRATEVKEIRNEVMDLKGSEQ